MKLRFGQVCALALLLQAAVVPSTVASEPRPQAEGEALGDSDVDELRAIMRNDLARLNHRQGERDVAQATRLAAKTRQEVPKLSPRDVTQFFQSMTSLPMPVAGLTPSDLDDSWGMPRDGGRRRHRGIDIFAPRGREVLAVVDGVVSYVGTQPKGGKSIWLVDEHGGYAFFYAHLDRYASGIDFGSQVRKGDVLGYVGNTGNARRSPPHLHFSVLRNDEAVNPYPLLTKRVEAAGTAPVLGGGFASAGGGAD